MWDPRAFMCVCQLAEPANITAVAAGLKGQHSRRTKEERIVLNSLQTPEALVVHWMSARRLLPRGEQALRLSVRM